MVLATVATDLHQLGNALAADLIGWGAAVIGVALVVFKGDDFIPAGIGLGIAAYGFAVAFFSTLSVWRIGRNDG